MRILHIINHLGIGGAETYVRNLAAAQQELGHQVAIAVCLRPALPANPHAQSGNAPPVELFHLNAGSGHDPRLPFALRRILQQFAPDIIHLSSLPLLGAFALRAAPATTIVTLHLMPNRQRWKRIIEWLYAPVVHGVITVSDAALRAHQQTGVFPRAQWTRIHNGIPQSAFPATPERAAPKPGEPVTLVMACRLEPEKGAGDALAVMACLKQPCASRPYHLQLLGDGSRLAALKTRADQLGVRDQIEFLGYQENVHPFLRQAHGVLLLSQRENFPFAALEAMAAGTPVFSYDIPGGLHELHQHNITGTIARERTPEAVAADIRRVMDDPARWRSYSRNAGKTAAAFPLAAMVEATTAFYLKIRA